MCVVLIFWCLEVKKVIELGNNLVFLWLLSRGKAYHFILNNLVFLIKCHHFYLRAAFMSLGLCCIFLRDLANLDFEATLEPLSCS